MKKDWVVWLGCLLLFVSGMLWGMIPKGNNFFKIKDVHDLFEMASSLATVLAVGLAFSQVNAWRKQHVAQSDHDLSQRLTAASLRYKEAVVVAHADAAFVLLNFHLGGLPPDLLDKLIPSIEAKLKSNIDRRSEFLLALQEGRAAWKSEISDKFDDLLNFSEHCNTVVRAFIDWSVSGGKFEGYKVSLERQYALFEANGWLHLEGSRFAEIDKLTSAADDVLREKAIRAG